MPLRSAVARNRTGSSVSATVDAGSFGRSAAGASRRQPDTSASGETGWRRLPALDGLRALAVIAVLLYHAGVAWLPGGLLGVDAFFVLSGFLITGLLLNEWRSTGRLDLKSFWARRARRLLPALLLLLVLVGVDEAVTGTGASRMSFRWDALSALGYVANWRFALSHQGYFGATAPSPLLHLWSLGVEEQFYLLWPLLAAAVLWLGRRIRGHEREALTDISVLLAIASTAWMAVLADRLHASTDRLYYGTDTRAAALLTGAALAAFTSAPLRHGRPSVWSRVRTRPRLLTAAGIAALAGLFAIWATTSGQAAWLYRGGFLLTAAVVALVLAAVVAAPRSVLSRVLGLVPLVWIGRISYGIYLYHWPLFLLLTHRRTGLDGTPLLLVRLGASVAIAALSFYAVEQPIRRGSLRLPSLKLLTPVGISVTAAAVLLTAGLPSAGGSSTSNLDAQAAQLARQTQQRLAELAPAPKPTPATASKTPAAPAEPVRTFIVGDSIAFSAAWALAADLKPYRIDVLSDAIIGCGIVPEPYAYASETSPIDISNCTGWRSQWQEAVQRFQPAVSAVFLGRWEITDRNQNGRVVHIGQPAFDSELSGLLDQAISILSARHGKVALIALPCITLPEQPDGSVAPSDALAREARYNALLTAAAERHPGVASVVDMNAQICPGGQVISSWHGMPLRQSDGIHFDERSGPALGPLLVEPLRRLAGAPAVPKA
jgi:peptidoglycan/LPS O-acetylase OafA/YrhL